MRSVTNTEDPATKRPRWAKARGNGEGTIYQDARGFYRAAVTLENGTRRYLSGRTRTDVAKKLNNAIQAREKGLPLPGLRLTTARYLTDWLENTVKPSRKPLTYEKYTQVVKTHLVPAIGKVPLAKLTPLHVQKIQAGMANKGLTVATINGMRTALSAALTQAEKWGLVTRNVVRLVDAPQAPGGESEPRVFQPDEATAFLAAAKGDDLEHIFATMLVTGLRAGEARGLRWVDVEIGGTAPAIQVRQQVVELLGRGRVFDDPKSQHGKRSIPLIPQAVAALQAQRRHVAEMRLHAGPFWQTTSCFLASWAYPCRATVRGTTSRGSPCGRVSATPRLIRCATRRARSSWRPAYQTASYRRSLGMAQRR